MNEASVHMNNLNFLYMIVKLYFSDPFNPFQLPTYRNNALKGNQSYSK